MARYFRNAKMYEGSSLIFSTVLFWNQWRHYQHCFAAKTHRGPIPFEMRGTWLKEGHPCKPWSRKSGYAPQNLCPAGHATRRCNPKFPSRKTQINIDEKGRSAARTFAGHTNGSLVRLWLYLVQRDSRLHGSCSLPVKYKVTPDQKAHNLPPHNRLEL